MTDKPTRRDFLSLTGAAASAGVVALILPKGAKATAGAQPAEGYDWSRHRWVYLIDTTKCIGCGSCVRACKAENGVPEHSYRTWIERYEIDVDGEAFVDSPEGGLNGFEPEPGRHVGKAFFVPKMCNHCAQTPCTQVCPVGASYTTNDGVVLVDAKHCIGCGYCVQACPYGSRYLRPDLDDKGEPTWRHTADKCTWCYHRITKGLQPACVQSCPVGARQFGDRKNPDDPINKILATERLHVLQPELLTKPQCYYRGLSMEVR